LSRAISETYPLKISVEFDSSVSTDVRLTSLLR